MSIRKLLAIILLLLTINGCGGGSRGTGDLTINGKAIQNDGTPLQQASISFGATGDSAITDSSGAFSIVTEAIDGVVEFIIESRGVTFITTGDALTGDIQEIEVELKVKFGENPIATQKVTIKKKRGEKDQDDSSNGDLDENDSDGSDNNNSGQNHDDNSDSSGKGQNDENSDKGENNGSRPDDIDSPGAGGGDNDDGNDEDNENEQVEAIRERGEIQEISANSVTVNGITFIINNETRFDKAESLSDFEVGDQVEVEGELRDNVYYAERIKFR